METLSSIMFDYDFALVDISAMSPMGMIRPSKLKIDSSSRKIKVNCYEEQFKFGDFLIENIDKNFYFPLLIFKELQNSSTSYQHRKKIKGMNGKKDRGWLELSRLIDKNCKQKNKLINLLEWEHKIISFNEKEQGLYDSFSGNYDYFQKKYELSLADFNFLISGLVLYCGGNKVSLISNDLGILSSWRKLLKYEIINHNHFEFFIRKNFPEVERVWD